MKIIISIILIFSFFIHVDSQEFSYPKHETGYINTKLIHNKSDTSFIITHSISQIIDPSTSVSCNYDGIPYNNSFYRVFDLSGDIFKLNGDWSVQKVEIGIGLAESGTGNFQTGILKLWTMSEYNGSSFILDSLTLQKDTVLFDIYDNESGTLKNINIIPAVSVPFGKVLVVEINIPDAVVTGENHIFFIGSNDEGQTDKSYIRASSCGKPEPISFENLGFPDMHIVMNVVGAYDAAYPEILSFDIEGQLTGEILNEPDYEINIVMPADTTLVALSPSISVPTGFYINPESDETVDFSEGSVEYIVTNESSKISQSWFANVTNAGPDIIDVEIANHNDETVIDNENYTATAYVPIGTDLTNISPTISIYDGFTISPESGVSQDFSTGAVTYTVSHETLPLIQDWEVSVIETVGSKIKTIDNKEIKIFPNPAYDILNIDILNLLKVELLNNSGKIILFSQEPKLNISELSAGVYFLKIHTGNGIYLKKLIVINNNIKRSCNR